MINFEKKKKMEVDKTVIEKVEKGEEAAKTEKCN